MTIKVAEVVTLSFMKAEYIAITKVDTEVLWLNHLLEELGQEKSTSSIVITKVLSISIIT